MFPMIFRFFYNYCKIIQGINHKLTSGRSCLLQYSSYKGCNWTHPSLNGRVAKILTRKLVYILDIVRDPYQGVPVVVEILNSRFDSRYFKNFV